MTVQAGENITTQWIFSALHPGDCFFYLSYDINKTEAEQAWFKISEIANCNGLSGINYTITIPYWVPSGQAILRWEWYALHLVTTIEFYSQCADITIDGNPQGVIGTPLAYVPYHLPQNNSNLLNYRDPYNTNEAFFFTGPALAKPSAFVPAPTGGSGSSGSGSSSSGSSTIFGSVSSSSGGTALGVVGGLAACGMVVAGGALLHRRYKAQDEGNRGLVADQQQAMEDPYRLIGDDTHLARPSGYVRTSAPSDARPSWPQQNVQR